MKTVLLTAVAVFVGIWAWSKFANKAPAKTKGPDMTVPVDTGTFFGPNVDPQTGAYLAPGSTPGAYPYSSQPPGPN